MLLADFIFKNKKKERRDAVATTGTGAALGAAGMAGSKYLKAKEATPDVEPRKKFIESQKKKYASATPDEQKLIKRGLIKDKIKLAKDVKKRSKLFTNKLGRRLLYGGLAGGAVGAIAHKINKKRKG